MTLTTLANEIKKMEKDLDTCPGYLKNELTRRLLQKKRQLELLTPYHAR